MVYWLKTLVALGEDPALVPSTSMVAHKNNYCLCGGLVFHPQYLYGSSQLSIIALLLLHIPGTCVEYIHIRAYTHTHEIKIKPFSLKPKDFRSDCHETSFVNKFGLELTEIYLPLPPKYWD